MSMFVVHNASGRILRYGVVPDDAVQMQAGAGEFALAVQSAVRDDTHYVSGGAVLPRVALPAFDKTTITADGADVATVTGLPNPTQATVRRAGVLTAATITDGTLEISSEAAGAIEVTLRADDPQYLEARVTIHAA